ncbi:class I SAM-dependent methyltransferase, partial [Candidatus Collierbacteria bacterium]|nr:class I SAM-dependent methyltransferase [Candidatus Collierbacteria bacterium]
ELLEEFWRLMKEEEKKEILDLGCGDGWISLKAAAEGFKVTGIDASETAITEAKREARKLGLEKRARFEVGDALNLPFRANTFEGIIDRGLFHHILPENRKRYLENIDRVLKAKGLVNLSVFSKLNPLGIGQRFKRKETERLFENYEVVKFKEDQFPVLAPAHLMHFILRKK